MTNETNTNQGEATKNGTRHVDIALLKLKGQSQDDWKRINSRLEGIFEAGSVLGANEARIQSQEYLADGGLMYDLMQSYPSLAESVMVAYGKRVRANEVDCVKVFSLRINQRELVDWIYHKLEAPYAFDDWHSRTYRELGGEHDE